MIEIKDLLLNFKNILVSEEIKKEIIVNAIKEATGLRIASGDVEMKNGVLRLDIKPIYKNEIFMKQDLILARLKEALGKKSPSELR